MKARRLRTAPRGEPAREERIRLQFRFVRARQILRLVGSPSPRGWSLNPVVFQDFFGPTGPSVSTARPIESKEDLSIAVNDSGPWASPKPHAGGCHCPSTLPLNRKQQRIKPLFA